MRFFFDLYHYPLPPGVDDPFMRKVWHRGKLFSGYRCNRDAFPARQIRYVVVVTEIEQRRGYIENGKRYMSYEISRVSPGIPGIGFIGTARLFVKIA